MAQVTLYLPDAVATEARRRAKRADKSLSAFLVEILTRETTRQAWPRTLVDLLSEGGAGLVEPDDPPPGDVDPLA